MAGVLASAVKEFDLAMDDIASNFVFVRIATKIRPRLSDMLDWKGLDGEAKTLAQSFLKQRTAEESLFYRGMVISLAGAFEQFVRRLLRDSVQAITAGGVRYDTLDEHMKLENAYRTGIALQTIREPLDYMDFDYETLAKNLGTCFDGSAKAILNADAFSIFLSVISPKSLVDALRRIGMDLRWDDLGRVDALRDTLGKRDTRETAKAIEEFLKRFGQTRNKIAHSGNTGIVITESDLEQLLKFFRVFAVALSSAVETQLSKRIKK